VDRDKKLKVHNLAGRMSQLCEEAASLCEQANGSHAAHVLSSTLSNIDKYIDFALVTTSEGPPDDVSVIVNMPDSDEQITLVASWDKDAEGFQLGDFPIELAPVGRVINAALLDRKHSGNVAFRWLMLPWRVE